MIRCVAGFEIALDGACVSCLPGTYSVGGIGSCIAAPIGFYAPEAQGSSLLPCEFSIFQGASTCSIQPMYGDPTFFPKAGYFSLPDAPGMQYLCPEGSFALPDVMECMKCEHGDFVGFPVNERLCFKFMDHVQAPHHKRLIYQQEFVENEAEISEAIADSPSNVQFCEIFTAHPQDFGNKFWLNTCKIRACSNKTVTLSMCPSLGGTCNVRSTNAYIHVYDSSGTPIAFSTDYCGVCPHLEFKRKEAGCDYYYIKQGCLLGCTAGLAVYNADVTPEAPDLVMGTNTSQQQIDALKDIFNDSDGFNWNGNSNNLWGSSAPVSSWSGVFTDVAGNIIQMDLAFFGLRGTFPEAFRNLTHLSFLHLHGNNLEGDISILGDMRRLIAVEVGSNLFTGTLPDVRNVSNLMYYGVGQNFFTGEITHFVSPTLNQLSISTNFISGYIPDTIAQDLPSLVVWNLGANLIYGSIPESVGDIKNLRTVQNHENLFTGTIPSSLGTSILTVLDLHSNSIIGSLPSSFSFSSTLISLTLQDNSMSGHLPTFSFPNLVKVQLEKNQFNGTIPVSFGLMTSVTYLSMNNNRLTGTIPEAICLLPKVFLIDVSFNSLTGTIPFTSGTKPALAQFIANDNSLTGAIPTSLCEATALSNLYVGGNSLCYPTCLNVPLQDYTTSYEHCWGEADVALCKTAEALHLFDTMQVLRVPQSTIVLESPHPRKVNSPSDTPLSFIVSVPGAFEYAVSFDCRVVTLGANIDICTNSSCVELLGHYRVPVYGLTAFPGCAGLQTLMIKRSSFFVKDYGVVAPGSPAYTTTTFGFLIHVVPFKRGTGWLCEDRPEDSARRHLETSSSSVEVVKYASDYCQWYGIICNYGSSILSLSLSALGLKGYIPTELAALSSLTTLILSYNSITGTIPTEFGAMSNLQDLQMVSNRLVGSIPSSICSLPVLTTLSLSSNFLSGSLPEYLNDLKSVSTLLLGSNQFSGKVPNNLCSLAHRSASVSIDLTQNPFDCFESCWSNVTTTSFDEALDVCAPTAQPTEAPTSHHDKLSDGGIAGIVIGSVVFVLAIALLVWHSFYLRTEKKYKHLPIHLAAVSGKEITESLLESDIDTACMLDYQNQTAVMQIFNSNHDAPVEIIVRLVLTGLSPNCVLADAPERYRDWWFLVQFEDSKSRAVVLQVLSAMSERADELAECTDLKGRRCVDIAEPFCKEAINRYRYLHQRYELRPGPPQHKSATSLVIFAVDHGKWNIGNLHRSNSQDENEVETAKASVALKFMTTKAQFDNELAMRSGKDLSSAYVIGILESYGDAMESDEYRRFYASASSKGFDAYPYCLLMPEADCSLKSYVDRQHIVGDWDEIRRLFKQVVTAVGHLHSRNIVHGDLKPMNVVMVGTSVRLIDLDAAVSCDPSDAQYAGRKYSSAYLPPELLAFTSSGNVVVKTPPDDTSDESVVTAMGNDSGYQLVKAAPSIDMWALGCLLYLMCSGMTLFRATVEDNIGYEPDMLELYEWTSFNKEERLSSVKDRLARNLLALLLNKDPIKRLDVSHVLSHPFLTGRSFSNRRLQGERPTYDVFLSYRVDSDSDHVELLYHKLVHLGLKVWWDKKCLLPGQPWEEGFCDGLVNSSCFVCLLSEGAINHPSKPWQNFSRLEAGSRCDNVLLEWRLAEEMRARDMLDGIFPVMIGRFDEASRTYSNYFASGCHPSSLPAVVVASVEHKLNEHLDRQNLGVPFLEHCTVQQVVTNILSNQGGFVVDDGEASWTGIAATIRNMSDIIIRDIKTSTALLNTSKSFISRSKSFAVTRVQESNSSVSGKKSHFAVLSSTLQACQALNEDPSSQMSIYLSQMADMLADLENQE